MNNVYPVWWKYIHVLHISSRSATCFVFITTTQSPVLPKCNNLVFNLNKMCHASNLLQKKQKNKTKQNKQNK